MKSPHVCFLAAAILLAALPGIAGELTPAKAAEASSIQCNNLIYAGGKTSVCFADKFLQTTAGKTGLKVAPNFRPVNLVSEALFDSPFTVISGDTDFRFNEKERQQLRKYLTCGGFLLASPGCSDVNWDACFRREMKTILPEAQFKKLPMSHPIFSTIFDIRSLSLKSGGTTQIEGVELNGRIVMIYSTEGLNDARNAKGCCCCGGNQIMESEQVNVNILIYSLTH